jgi:serralysin
MSLNLVLAYESSALAAPLSFRNAMQAAANILDSVIQDNITVTIQVGYGDWNNGQDTGITTGAEGGDLNGFYDSYSGLRSTLAIHETSSVDQTFVNSLPNASTVNGVSSLWVPSAVGKALGLISPTGTAVDGAVGMGTQIPTSLLVGVALHELTHAMGREPWGATFDLFRYTSPGNHLFTTSGTAVPAYFSIDGGYTKLADFGQTSDSSDFLNSGVQGSTDSFNEFYSSNTLQSLTTVDIKLLDALGFNTTPQVVTVIESSGSTSLTKVGNNLFLDGSGGTGPMLKYAGASVLAGQFGATIVPIAAEITASGYEVAWKDVSANHYSVWSTDSNGNYTSNIIGSVSGNDYALESLETSFHQDLNGDGVIGLVTTVIESAGSTSLTQVANQYFLYNSGGVGPSLKYAGAAVVAGQFGASIVPIGAEAIAGGYEIAWKDLNANHYSVWSTDSNGNYVSNIIGSVSGTDASLESIETSFHQDLNGDGTIGTVQVVIESNGATSLIKVGTNYYLKDSSGSGPSLKYNGVDYVAGQFGADSAPIAAEAITGGYEVAWKVMSANLYSVWRTDSNGNYVSNIIGSVTGNDLSLALIEPSFHQDLNGDGTIGPIVVESTGATSLVNVGTHYYLTDSGGAGPSLKYHGVDYVAGQFGASIVPIAAEAIAGGYEIAWKDLNANHYSVWSTDSNGNYVSNIIGSVSGNDLSLALIEPSFHQDLNGDGTIGPIVVEANGATSLVNVGTHYYLTDSGGSGPSLKYHSVDYVAGQFGTNIVPIAAEAIAGGYEIAWKDVNANHYSVWTTDSSGNYVSNIIGSVSGTDASLESIETIFHQDLNGDGHIGLVINAGATLDLPGAEAGIVTFTGSTGSLKLDTPSTFTGSIAGFTGDGTLSGSDHIDLTNLAFSSLVQADSTYDTSTQLLHVSNGSTTDVLQFIGSYTQANFKFAADGNGGTIVYDPPAAIDIAGNRTITGSASLIGDQVTVENGAVLTLDHATAGGATITNNSTVNVTNNSAVNIAAGTGRDTFVFAPDFGQATIAGFRPGTDTIQIDHAVFASMDALLAATHDDAHGNAVIADAAHDTITLQHVTTAQLLAHQDGFHLV